MDLNEKIDELEGNIVDLKFQLKDLKYKSDIYLSTLQDIKHSCADAIKTNDENIRFKLGDGMDVGVIQNILEYLENITRLYNIKI